MAVGETPLQEGREMSAIESSGFPLVFKADAPDIDAVDAELGVEVLGRCLEGMQKEALVRVGESPPWRMVSDEGPYLEGTDLAPFPLAFFTPGCSSHFSPSSRGYREKKASHFTRRGLLRTTSIRWRARFSAAMRRAGRVRRSFI